MPDSQELLAEYAQTGSETAFGELVKRYVNLVYSAAVRLVEDNAHLAEDITQTVFADLAHTAPSLSKDVMLGGWLHRHTCFVAAKTMRSERRRQSRERQAVEMNALQDDSGADLSLVAPLLDDAVNQLDEADRAAILLRFFEQRDFRSIGDALGSNEDAARMRVHRALEKLQDLLKRRGVATTASALGVALSASAIQAAPAGLALTITAATFIAAPTIVTATTLTATNAIAMTILGKAIIGAALVAAVGTGIYEASVASTLRSQNQALLQQQAPLSKQVQQLTRERDNALQQLAPLKEENEDLNRKTAELARLRNELSLLRKEGNQQKMADNSRPDENPAATPDYISKDSLAFAGFAVPEATMKSFAWAAANGDLNTLLACVGSEQKAQFEQAIQSGSQAKLVEKFQKEMEMVKGIRILKRKVVSDNEVVATVFVEGQNDLTKWTLKRFGIDWKLTAEQKIH